MPSSSPSYQLSLFDLAPFSGRYVGTVEADELFVVIYWCDGCNDVVDFEYTPGLPIVCPVCKTLMPECEVVA
jgi:hypothetical protein